MAEMLTVAQHHRTYDRDVVPKQAGEAQRRGVKAAFYAGASAVLYVIEQQSKQMDAAATLKVLRGMHNEIEDFNIAVRTGKDQAPPTTEGKS